MKRFCVCVCVLALLTEWRRDALFFCFRSKKTTSSKKYLVAIPRNGSESTDEVCPCVTLGRLFVSIRLQEKKNRVCVSVCDRERVSVCVCVCCRDVSIPAQLRRSPAWPGRVLPPFATLPTIPPHGHHPLHAIQLTLCDVNILFKRLWGIYFAFFYVHLD